MSWITGLADKAENILNKIDQNAATALQLPASGTSTNSPTRITSSASAPLINALQYSVQNSSFNNSTESLKTALSTHWTTTGSSKSENLNGSTITQRLKNKSNLSSGNNFEPTKTSTRRSSVSSKEDSLCINMENEENEETTIEDVETEVRAAIAATPDQMSSSSSFPTTTAQELAAFRIALSEITAERDELRLRLSALNRDVENKGLKQRTQELEMLAIRLTEERDRAQIELHDAQTSSAAYIHSISELETNLAKLQQEYMETMQKLQMQKKETDFQRQQLQEYRTKAQLAFVMKDKLLEEHKANIETRNTTETTNANDEDNIGEDNNVTKDNAKTHLLQLELDTLKQEQINWLDENKNLLQQLEDMRTDWHVFQRKQAENADKLRIETDELRKELNQQREQTLSGEADRRMLLLQLQQLKDKEQQLRAEQKILKRASVSISVEQQDNRMESLTNALVEKQNAVENLTAERNALRIQLEKVKDQLQQSIFSSAQMQAQRNNALLNNSTDDTKAQYPLLMKENPFDNRVARRVKRAYTSLDSAGVRLGAFLRRYPLMRIFVLMYVALLHIWVMFVLFVNMK